MPSTPPRPSRAHGSSEQFTVGGSEEQKNDSIGPSIYCYLNSPSFVDGGNVNTTPFFVAKITDKDGINAAGSGIGHDLQLVIDGDMSKTYNAQRQFHLRFRNLYQRFHLLQYSRVGTRQASAHLPCMGYPEQQFYRHAPLQCGDRSESIALRCGRDRESGPRPPPPSSSVMTVQRAIWMWLSNSSILRADSSGAMPRAEYLPLRHLYREVGFVGRWRPPSGYGRLSVSGQGVVGWQQLCLENQETVSVIK